MLSPPFVGYYLSTMRDIPFFKQENEYYCGPAIIQMIAGAYGLSISQQEAARIADTTEADGTMTHNLVEALRGLGASVGEGDDKNLEDIRKALAEDAIVVVCYTEPIEEWGHYAIVQKLDGEKIVLIDPDARTGSTTLMIDEFERRWQDPLFTKSTRWAAFVTGGPSQKQSR